MFDMRYHIASLVAVFLALAIGILLGTVIVDKGVLVDQQKTLVNRIEGNFTELRSENRALGEEVAAQRNFAAQVTPLAMKDRLTGKNVVVVATTPVKNEVMGTLVEDLKKAGATANTITIVENFKPTDTTITQLKPFFPSPTQLKIENAEALMIKKMVEDITSTTGASPTSTTSTTPPPSSTTTTTVKTSFLATLKDMGFIKTDMNIDNPVKAIGAVVVFGGSDENRDPLQVDMPVILQLKSLKIRTVGVEASGCKHSFMQNYQGANIPTVDNVDQPTGRVSTVFALAGTDGNFGMKKTAERLMPTVDTNQ